ncbi:T7SS effector LXG polymorphic toxin [Niallia sp. Man26]|uniref:ribonuclease YeeF family protein n=1 Tax=Niallia sp. Man26 TaxID=2912824 RepID=UPI001EDB6A29|nr:T7SS effector LXG polymorphic toxin [Niallia sp. Man26]UPO87356.1 T7SS effector LXG polymorphic toxin [Niallia sp. Man26]
MKILDASSLQDTMEQRAKHYDKLRDQFTALRKAFQEIIDLDDFEGRGAEAIKAFYQGQIEVVEAWQRLFDRQIAFFESVGGKLSDKDLDGNTRVETAFLEEDLVQKERQADEMITEQRRALENIFRDIDDLVSLDAFSRDKFDDLMMDASKKRTKTIEAVEDTDQELKEEYLTSEGEEAYAIQLFSALLGATKQGSSISPIHFDADAYQASDIYKLKGEAEAATLSYITYKKEEQQAREIAEQPTSEKVWGGIKSFVGEFTGYYDYKRAVEGVDPVTGEKMSTAQRLAAGGMALAGFIPVVGWAGRAVKGGKGIYSATKGISAAENAMSTYKNVKAFSTLEKTEMGIYGLLSANGLSEYVTGKDMFGNELTDQQRQASITQSIFAGLPFVPGMAKEANRLGQQALNSTVQIGKQGADVSRAFMDDLGRSLNTSPNAAFAGGVGNMNSYLKAESRADVGKVSGDKSEYLSMLSGRGSGIKNKEVVKEGGADYVIGTSGTTTHVKDTDSHYDKIKEQIQERYKHFVENKKQNIPQTSNELLPNELNHGKYGKLPNEIGDNITGHHMPSNKYMQETFGIKTRDSYAMFLEHPHPGQGGRHRRTFTYGLSKTTREEDFDLYMSLKPRDTLAFDINDLRRILKEDGLYNQETRKKIEEYINYYRTYEHNDVKIFDELE